MFRSLSRPLVCLCALCGLLCAVSARADTIVAARRIDLPGTSLQDVRIQLVAGVTPDTLKINLHADKADVSALGWRHVAVTLQGTVRRDAQLRWLLDGTVQAVGAPGNALSNANLALIMDSSANTLEVDATQGTTHIGTALPLDQPSHMQIDLHDLPAGWLQGLLATAWGGHISNGKVNAEMAIDVRDQGFLSSGDFAANDLTYTTPSGNVAGEGLTGHARFALDATQRPAQLTFNGGVHSGQFQFGPLFARLPDHDVALDITATMERGGANISRLHVDDADALQADGAVSLDAKGNLQKVRLDHFEARFPAAYDRYAQSSSGATPASDLHLSGQVDGHLDYASNIWRSLALHSDGLDVTDSAGQWQAHDIHGSLDWAEQGERPTTVLGWSQLTWRKFSIGAMPSRWRSHGGTFALQSPLDISVLQGQLHLTALDWRPGEGKGQHLNLAANLTGIDLAAVDEMMGWMPIAGRMDGTLSAMQWTNERYALDGTLTVKAFDGTATLTHLTVQRPLSDAPIITSDVALHQLNLAPLADAFNFGSMTGRLNGSIENLELVGGEPVAFKTTLIASEGGKISLRAANNLSIITGGTPASGFHGAVMKLFNTLNYKRMGINASLQDGTCSLSGIDGDSTGYTIVEGNGLPYLHVVGEQTHVDWPVFVRRLKAATQATVADR